MVLIDGEAGEGGGQVLRTALGLSLVTQVPFRITRIRGKRAKPGLLRQHLTCVKAAATLGGAEVDGDVLGSSELTFRPKTMQTGSFEFAVGSAGSTSLVLQSVLPALLMATAPTTLVITGGTHNSLAPPFDFLQRSFAPVAAKLGAKLDLRLLLHGFEPAGGGRIEVTVSPSPLNDRLELMHRGALRSRDAVALVSSVPLSVAHRELAVVRRDLDFTDAELHTREVPSPGPGNALSIALVYEHVTDLFVGLGARGVTAEKVAHRTTGLVKRSQRTDAPVGEYLADQLLIPLALAKGGSFRTTEPSLHTRTQLELIPRFLGVAFTAQPEPTGTWRMSVRR